MFQPPSIFPQVMLKLPPWFGGQVGIAGSDTALGLRTRPRGIVVYVDPGHPAASDGVGNDGTDPNFPFATIQRAVNSPSLVSHSTIVLQPGNDYVESVVTPDYVTGPNYVTILGAGHGRYSLTWQSDLAATPALDLRAVGWRVENIRFLGQTASACVELRHTDSGANDIAIRTQIINCYFDGLTTGRYGILSHGCYDVWVVGCTFSLWNNAVAGGAVPMLTDVTPLAIPYRNYIIGNFIHDSNNGIVWPGNGNFYSGNMFQPTGVAYAMTLVLQTSIVANPGIRNIVWGNVFPGDYSIVGGYRSGVGDAWLGNWADDVAEAEVGDNGITILPPA